ncbi:hypothetical protein KKE03_00640 [Patescibacteria group bacterium]|nr:hypothetical protein [Patescibacteria group bacterium]
MTPEYSVIREILNLRREANFKRVLEEPDEYNFRDKLAALEQMDPVTAAILVRTVYTSSIYLGDYVASVTGNID